MAPQPRSEADLRDRQGRGQLRVSTALTFRRQVAAEGLEAAYAATDVVVASNAEFTDQASLVLNLGPSDPPIRIRRFQLDGVGGWGGHGSTDLVVPIGGGLVEPLRRGGAQVLGQIQIARFSNPAGLQAIGQNMLKETTASGAPVVSQPGQTGAGQLMQGALEASNVNVVEEMVNMIETQRAYEINSKAISAVDGMLRFLNNNM